MEMGVHALSFGSFLLIKKKKRQKAIFIWHFSVMYRHKHQFERFTPVWLLLRFHITASRFSSSRRQRWLHSKIWNSTPHL